MIFALTRLSRRRQADVTRVYSREERLDVERELLRDFGFALDVVEAAGEEHREMIHDLPCPVCEALELYRKAVRGKAYERMKRPQENRP